VFLFGKAHALSRRLRNANNVNHMEDALQSESESSESRTLLSDWHLKLYDDKSDKELAFPEELPSFWDTFAETETSYSPDPSPSPTPVASSTAPSSQLSATPSESSNPSPMPSIHPTASSMNSIHPTASSIPSDRPTSGPTAASIITSHPSQRPSDIPSMAPSESMVPSDVPLLFRSAVPTLPGCYRNLTRIFEIEIEVQDETILRTYILCPDSVFDIGPLDEMGQLSDQYPILPRSNAVYYCGEDGLSTNNCVLRGGPFQVLMGFKDSGADGIKNVLIQGVTFEAADERALVLDKPGDITFIDCIVRVSENVSKFYSEISCRLLTPKALHKRDKEFRVQFSSQVDFLGV
jgi:hypothetical protein